MSNFTKIRCAAQVLIHKVMTSRKFSADSCLNSIYKFIDENRAIAKIRNSQTKILDDFDPVKSSTVDGIYSENSFSLFDAVKKAMKQFLESVPGKYGKILPEFSVTRVRYC